MVELIIGKNCKIDSTAILGCLPGRKLSSYKLKIGANAIIRSGNVIYAGTEIGNNFETGHNVVVREDNIIGDNFKIWNNSTVDYGCKIGNHVKIHSNVYVAQYTIIEDYVFLSPGVMIANDLHPICGKCMKGPTIKRGTRVGVNATLFPHITIGENSLIGAGSVVTADIPPNSVAYGVPAEVRGSIYDLKCKMGFKKFCYKNPKIRCH
ncbi:MAG: DapH/DapD/GlmU-related protein [bacterium]|nr:DapH/DapD/GlmU-related protein [bacterium]